MLDNDHTLPQTNNHSEKNSRTVNIFVHTIRILIKAGIIVALFLGEISYALPLSIYLVISEIVDQTIIYISQRKHLSEKIASMLYIINSVGVLSIVAYYANWIQTDFYLIFLVHISSATFAYGPIAGLISLGASTLTYTFLLSLSDTPLILFLRLPLIGIIVMRIIANEFRVHSMDKSLQEVLNIEKAKQDFIAIASHNLRTPVAAIYGYIELLNRGDAGSLNRDQLEYIDRIKRNNEELDKLVEQLLQISIYEVGDEINLFNQPCQISFVIEEVLENTKHLAEKKNIRLIYEKPSKALPLINVDVEKIKSVVTNLIDNAIKYTDTGSVKVNTFAENNYLVIEVQDTGIGIAPEEIPNLFSRFYRAGDILVYNQPGAGLGLYIGKKIIDLYHGTITAESEKNAGSTFRIKLPLMKDK